MFIAIVTAIGLVIALIFNIKQFRQMKNQLKNTLFAEYTKRYQEIILNFPEEINDDSFTIKKLPKQEYDKTMRYMRVYYDLCSEEYFLHKKRHLDNDVWKEWKEGMVFAFKKKAFKDAWKIITEKSSLGPYSAFKKFVDSKIEK